MDFSDMNYMDVLDKQPLEREKLDGDISHIPKFDEVSENDAGFNVASSVLEAIPSFEVESTDVVTAQEVNESEDLAKDQQLKVVEASEYSDEVTESIKTIDELAVYEEAGLQEMTINERPVIGKSDLDLAAVDPMGRTNQQRMESGLSPIGKDGKPLELHHIGQNMDSPLAELTSKEHRSNDAVLHDKTVDTEIDRAEFSKERKEHWQARVEQIKSESDV